LHKTIDTFKKALLSFFIACFSCFYYFITVKKRYFELISFTKNLLFNDVFHVVLPFFVKKTTQKSKKFVHFRLFFKKYQAEFLFFLEYMQVFFL
jgi:hypothetical protein